MKLKRNVVPRVTISDFSALNLDNAAEQAVNHDLFLDDDNNEVIADMESDTAYYVTLDDVKSLQHSRIDQVKSYDDCWSYTNTNSNSCDEFSDDPDNEIEIMMAENNKTKVRPIFRSFIRASRLLEKYSV